MPTPIAAPPAGALLDVAVEQRDRFVDVRALVGLESGELRVGVLAAFLDEIAQPLRVSQVEHPHAAARDLVLVCGADASSRGSYGNAGAARAIDQLVIRQNEMRAIADVEPALYVYAICY